MKIKNPINYIPFLLSFYHCFNIPSHLTCFLRIAITGYFNLQFLGIVYRIYH